MSSIDDKIEAFEQDPNTETFNDLYTVINEDSSFTTLDEDLFRLCFELDALSGVNWEDRYENVLADHLQRYESQFSDKDTFTQFQELFINRNKKLIQEMLEDLEEQMYESVDLNDIL